MVRNKYEGYTCIYTDGSKRAEEVGAAMVWEERAKLIALSKVANIYTSEGYAIGMKVQHVKEQGVGRCVIVSDSCSVLSAITRIGYKNIIIRKIQHEEGIGGRDVVDIFTIWYSKKLETRQSSENNKQGRDYPYPGTT